LIPVGVSIGGANARKDQKFFAAVRGGLFFFKKELLALHRSQT
jgi:hypothetical protein